MQEKIETDRHRQGEGERVLYYLKLFQCFPLQPKPFIFDCNSYFNFICSQNNRKKKIEKETGKREERVYIFNGWLSTYANVDALQ